MEYYHKDGDLLKHLKEGEMSPKLALDELSEIVMVESKLNGVKILSAS